MSERSVDRAAAAAASRRLGADPGQLQHRPEGTTSAVYALDDPAVVLLVAAPGTARAELAARVELSAALAAAAPVVRPLPGLAQPLEVEGRLVSAWERVATVPGRPGPRALGRALRALHEVPVDSLPAGGASLRRRDDLSDVRQDVSRLRARGRLGARDAATLLRVADAVEDGTGALRGARVVLHGDLHGPNLLPTVDGVVLCDVDEVGVGSADHDLGFLVDPGRPTLREDERAAFEEGYGAVLPDRARARTAARCAHLRRTVRQLGLQRRPLRERAYDRLRLAAWEAWLLDREADLHPVVALPRPAQAGLLLRRARPFARSR